MQFGQLKRREFITLLGGSVMWPLTARAQHPSGMRRIGMLMGIAESDAGGQAWVQAFRVGIRERGWTEGDNVRVDYRWAAGVAERFQTAAAELVALKPDVILADTTPDWTAIRRCASRDNRTASQGEMNHELNVTFQLTDWRPRHGDKCSAGYLFPTDPVITSGERSQRLLLNALRSFPA